MTGASAFLELEAKAAAGQAFDLDDVRRVLTAVDLVRIGMLGEAARRRLSREVITFGRVALAPAGQPGAVGEAGEVRITGVPRSIDEAVAWVSQVASVSASAALTGFSLADLSGLAGAGEAALAAAARVLREAGLEAVAEVPVDRFDSTEALVAAVGAVRAGGIRAWRATVDRAETTEARLAAIGRAHDLQVATGALRAFAPLPRRDDPGTPSTGYDDVRTVAVARLACPEIPVIQVDWPLYGPKLAQVGIAFGAGDIDGIDAVDAADLGPRRTAGAEIARQIRAAAAEPVERNGRYERLS